MKEALKLALEALEIEESQTHYPSQWLLKAIATIKEALAKPEQEPVSMYRNKCADGSRCLHGCHTNEPCYTSPQPAPVQGWKLVPLEPTDEMLDSAQERIDDIYRLDAMHCYEAMLAAAPQPAQQQPLTFARLCEIEAAITYTDGHVSLVQFARAIEAAHNIKG